MRAYLFVDFDANGALSDVPDTTGATVVEFVRHTLVDGTIHLYVDIVADVVDTQVGSEGNGAALPEAAREEISGPRP